MKNTNTLCFNCGREKEEYEALYCDKCWEKEQQRSDFMSVKELSREQLIELKTAFYTENNDNVSWGELANIDKLVSDETIFNEYGATIFTEDDFFCTCGQEN